ncbi:MAG TPA: gliding motility-associated C-terminal domain-containing protein, partial [Ferruginibacter sp.]|nr:gliding motility-associated C-terminal domain-containing protein [Ferruginibacter sp.]
SYFWSPSANLDNPRVANPTAIQLNGSISYYLHVSDANGCNSLKRDTVRVTVTRPAIVFAGRDTVLAINQPLPLHAVDVNNIGFIQYTWSPAYGLNDASSQNPIAIPDKDITYTLTARNSIGCIAVDDIKVKVYKGPNIYVPNAFTPNGDGLNDRLRAIPVGIRDFHYFRLFDRWGNMIFSTEDPRYGWDGKIRGTAQPTGAYVWIAEGVDYRGNIIQRKGTVTIAR